MLRKLHHSPQKTILWTATQQNRPIAVCSNIILQRGFNFARYFAGRFPGYIKTTPLTVVLPRTLFTGWRMGRMRSLHPIHNRLRVIATAFFRRQRLSTRPQMCFTARKIGDRPKTSHNPLDIAVNHNCPPMKGTPRVCRRQQTNTRQLAEFMLCIRSFPLRHDSTSTGQQITRPAWLAAKTSPRPHDVIVRCRCQIRHCRPRLHKFLTIGTYCGDRCLLQYDFDSHTRQVRRFPGQARHGNTRTIVVKVCAKRRFAIHDMIEHTPPHGH